MSPSGGMDLRYSGTEVPIWAGSPMTLDPDMLGERMTTMLSAAPMPISRHSTVSILARTTATRADVDFGRSELLRLGPPFWSPNKTGAGQRIMTAIRLGELVSYRRNVREV